MTPKQAARKYTNSDGVVELPSDVVIRMPKRSKAVTKIKRAVKALD